MLSDLLKEKTQQAHQDLEKVIVKRIRDIHSEADYIALLKNFYGYIQPVEQLIESALDENVVPDKLERRKASWLLNDILAFEPKERNLSQATDLPDIRTAEQALGAMYVLEGSTLGGKYIVKMIAERIGPHANGLSFFTGYDDQTEQKWEFFKRILNQYKADSSKEQRVVAAANETFEKFKKWVA